jgi:pimeloyl-ACP methyl ester carboxylesterase
MDSLLFIQAVWSLQEHSAWDLLPEIQCPTMIFAAEKDTFTPLHCSQKIADNIPNSELVFLSDASHAALIEQPEIINYRLDRFFASSSAS